MTTFGLSRALVSPRLPIGWFLRHHHVYREQFFKIILYFRQSLAEHLDFHGDEHLLQLHFDKFFIHGLLGQFVRDFIEMWV